MSERSMIIQDLLAGTLGWGSLYEFWKGTTKTQLRN